MWAVISRTLIKKIRCITAPRERAEARRRVAELWELGVFSRPATENERKAQAFIRTFLDEPGD